MNFQDKTKIHSLHRRNNKLSLNVFLDTPHGVRDVLFSNLLKIFFNIHFTFHQTMLNSGSLLLTVLNMCL